MKFYLNKPVIEIDEGFYDINPLPVDFSNLEEGECYAFDGYALIYYGKVKDLKGDPKVGFYLDNNNELFINLPEDLKEKYSTKNIKEFNVSDIIDEMIENSDSFTSPEDMEVIQNSSDITVPTIRDNDDFLTKIVKRVIIAKKINLKNYEHKVDKSIFTNMKGSLNTEGRKMSVMYFKRWAEVLGFDFQIIINDDGTDRLAPLKETIEFNSEFEDCDMDESE